MTPYIPGISFFISETIRPLILSVKISKNCQESNILAIGIPAITIKSLETLIGGSNEIIGKRR
jgi:hypothetical protein